MSFLTKRPTLLKQFLCTRMWSRTLSLGQTLPKFPYPNNDMSTRHQQVKARPPPIYPDAFAKKPDHKALMGNPVPTHPRKYVEFLRYDEDDEDDVAMKGSRFIPKVEFTDEMQSAGHSRCVPEPEVADKTNRTLWERQRHHGQHWGQRDKSYSQKGFKMQHENMPMVQNNINRIRQHLDSVKVQQRMQQLMQLQPMLDESEPSPLASYEPEHYANVCSGRNRIDLKPGAKMLAKSVVNNNGNQTNSPPKSMVDIRLDPAANRDTTTAQGEASKDSAIYKLCKRTLVYRNARAKY